MPSWPRSACDVRDTSRRRLSRVYVAISWVTWHAKIALGLCARRPHAIRVTWNIFVSEARPRPLLYF